VSEFKIVCEMKGENAQGPAAAPEITCALKIAGAAKLLARWSSQRNTLLFLSRWMRCVRASFQGRRPGPPRAQPGQQNADKTSTQKAINRPPRTRDAATVMTPVAGAAGGGGA
jgi:hypothetical protein